MFRQTMFSLALSFLTELIASDDNTLKVLPKNAFPSQEIVRQFTDLLQHQILLPKQFIPLKE